MISFNKNSGCSIRLADGSEGSKAACAMLGISQDTNGPSFTSSYLQNLNSKQPDLGFRR
jgi:hypothetical protein